MTTLICRDPFARTELRRTIVADSARKGCDWCGGKRVGGKLFAYLTESDSGRVSPIKGQYCSVNCMRSYHG